MYYILSLKIYTIYCLLSVNRMFLWHFLNSGILLHLHVLVRLLASISPPYQHWQSREWPSLLQKVVYRWISLKFLLQIILLQFISGLCNYKFARKLTVLVLKDTWVLLLLIHFYQHYVSCEYAVISFHHSVEYSWVLSVGQITYG